MPFEIVTIPCLKDNYAFLMHDAASNMTAIVDVPEAAPVAEELEARGWSLDYVLLTHHHGDHIGGVPKLLAKHPAKVIGAAADAHRLPALDLEVAEGDTFDLGGESVQVLDVSGHTLGHIAFYFPDSKAVATGDSLMALGCGRVYGDGPEQLYDSLVKIAALPSDILVMSGHEFTQKNADFALTIDGTNEALIARAAEVLKLRTKGRPTIPSTLAEELETNPFLRCDDTNIRREIGMEDATSAEVFAEIRQRKNNF